ncbi:hypothetical protein JAAARDRAFT_81169 [Jaapia argillacea MUCL 33604]|uniref:Uncharacterized protein n=1 Tax=Jaapia argillacea MUCL 33604 TaxID=933084 RepID=A0A067PM57_9AGAM|nr:hypothetical protein JAAARDRAFT_81169 [Jaapia argillacea MUCL 33604]
MMGTVGVSGALVFREPKGIGVGCIDDTKDVWVNDRRWKEIRRKAEWLKGWECVGHDDDVGSLDFLECCATLCTIDGRGGGQRASRRIFISTIPGGRPQHNPTATTFRDVVALIPVQIVSFTKKERGLVLTLDDGGPSLSGATSCGKTSNLVLESFSLGWLLLGYPLRQRFGLASSGQDLVTSFFGSGSVAICTASTMDKEYDLSGNPHG